MTSRATYWLHTVHNTVIMSAATPSEITTQRFNQIFNVVKELDGHTLKSYRRHAWSFGDFSRTGKLGLWNIHKFMELDRLSTYQMPNGETFFVGMVNTTIGTFTRELYRAACLDYPMKCWRDYGYIGNTSFSLVIECRSQHTGQLLARVERQTVTIDPVTRRPIPVPEHVSELRGRYPNKGTHVVVQEPPTQPGGYHTYQLKVAASDTDQLYHVNQAIYHKYCLDAAYDAGRLNFLKNFTEDICEYEVEKCVAKHSGEAHAGDVIKICVWEDLQHPLILHFKVTKYEKNMFFSTVTFAPHETSRI